MLTLQILDQISGVRHAFFTREGGVSSGIYASLNCGYGSDDDRDNVTANRGLAMARIDLSSTTLATTYQVHGTAVKVVEDGAMAGVLEETIAAMVRRGARASNIAAGVGPCIAQVSYEVGPEFRERFLVADKSNVTFFDQVSGRNYFDLEGYIVARLRRLGITTVERSGVDTCANHNRFFSYRRACLENEPDFGRGMSVIALTG